MISPPDRASAGETAARAAGDAQKEHYERIHDDYERHYYDASSMAYRSKFVYEPLFAGFDLNDKTVADLACGSGHNSVALLERFPRALPIGFDISSKACESYRRLVGREAHLLDLTLGEDPGIRVDAAMIFGGLHHCVAELPATFRTIAAMVKPGGHLFMYEPNREYLLHGLRRLWYRLDKYFDAATEDALSHDDAVAAAAGAFSPLSCRYMGGPAYFLIFNSLLFRIPVGAKRLVAQPLFGSEALYNRLPGRCWYPYFVAQWSRTEATLAR